MGRQDELVKEHPVPAKADPLYDDTLTNNHTRLPKGNHDLKSPFIRLPNEYHKQLRQTPSL